MSERLTTATERQTPSLTARQKILLAAAELAARDEGNEAFSATELVVRAWQRYPESFSLQGSEHPDSNAVLAKLSGADGLCGLGWFERVAQKRYRLTRRGRELGEQLLPPPPAPRAPRPEAVLTVPPPPPSPIRPEEAATVRFVADLAQSDALRKFLRGSPLTAVDAKRFWGIERLAEADARIAETEQRLKRAVASFSSDRPGIPGLPSLSTCFGLLALHRMMSARFAGEVA